MKVIHIKADSETMSGKGWIKGRIHKLLKIRRHKHVNVFT